MTHTVIQSETVEWEEEYCDNCNHLASRHYDEPEMTDFKPYRVTGEEKAKTLNNYTQVGCMNLKSRKDGGRMLPDNPHPRCPCMKLV